MSALLEFVLPSLQACIVSARSTLEGTRRPVALSPTSLQARSSLEEEVELIYLKKNYRKIVAFPTPQVECLSSQFPVQCIKLVSCLGFLVVEDSVALLELEEMFQH